MRRTKIWMATKKHLPQKEIDEIMNHLEATADTMVKWYTLSQLAALDGVDTRTVRNSGKYIPVRIDTHIARREFRNRWKKKKPYSIRRIRVDEIKFIFNKRNRKYKLEEQPK